LFLDLIKRKNLTRFKPNRGEIDKRKRKEGSEMKNKPKKRVAEKRELINHQIKSNNNQFKPGNKKSQEIYSFTRQGRIL